MRCLWLTWIDPAPEHDGQRIYSGRMIDAVAARGVGIDILCFHSELHRARGDPDDIVRWWLVPREERPGWWSVFSRLPNLSHRCDTQAMRRRFRELLRQRDWDTIVMDGLSTGWALDPIAAHYGDRGDRPRLIYISHNHEETTRALVAENFKGNPLMAAALRIDARKATLLEHRMMDEVDVISAVTPEDAEQFALRVANKPVFVLSPGYGGRRVSARRIDGRLPRRALLVGSFEWLAKQMNLTEFLTAADPIFATAGAEIQVVGNGERDFFDRLRPQLRGTEIVGPVDDVKPYLDNARVAIIPERSGGGFKVKMLDYVFNRVPVAALEHSYAGVPVVPGESVLTFATHEALARGVVDVIDNFDLLNGLQQEAYGACADEFDWSQRGETLVAMMTRPLPNRNRAMPRSAASPLMTVQP